MKKKKKRCGNCDVNMMRCWSSAKSFSIAALLIQIGSSQNSWLKIYELARIGWIVSILFCKNHNKGLTDFCHYFKLDITYSPISLRVYEKLSSVLRMYVHKFVFFFMVTFFLIVFVLLVELDWVWETLTINSFTDH